jgi:hypothetical protein
MTIPSLLVRSLSLALALSIAHGSARAQAGCAGTIVGDVSVVSVSTGGVQNLSLTVTSTQALQDWHVLGSMSGTSPGQPYLAYGGLFLNQDRYMYAMITGHSPLVHGGVPSAYGVVPSFDSQGHANLQVVVPPVVLSALVGRTVYHGFYTLNVLDLLPDCGSNTVALTFVP